MSTLVSKILTCHIIKSYSLEINTSPLMLSFPTATEHRGAASFAFILVEAATRGVLWKTLQNF